MRESHAMPERGKCPFEVSESVVRSAMLTLSVYAIHYRSVGLHRQADRCELRGVQLDAVLNRWNDEAKREVAV